MYPLLIYPLLSPYTNLVTCSNTWGATVTYMYIKTRIMTRSDEVSTSVLDIIIGASLSEPHTSVTSLRSACVCLLACLDLQLP